MNPTDAIDRAIEEFGDLESEIRDDLNSLWAELLAEEIIFQNESFCEASLAEIPEKYEKSVFQRYADMQDLLALDPIHEVDDEGWKKKEEDES